MQLSGVFQNCEDRKGINIGGGTAKTSLKLTTLGSDVEV